jgi:hypothetical protein
VHAVLALRLCVALVRGHGQVLGAGGAMEEILCVRQMRGGIPAIGCHVIVPIRLNGVFIDPVLEIEGVRILRGAISGISREPEKAICLRLILCSADALLKGERELALRAQKRLLGGEPEEPGCLMRVCARVKPELVLSQRVSLVGRKREGAIRLPGSPASPSCTQAACP